MILDDPIIPNLASDCRDHLANERTFLSWVKMSMGLAIVGAAMLIRFNITDEFPELFLDSSQVPPNRLLLDRRISRPIGILLFAMSISCVLVGLFNYLATCNWYNYPYHHRDMLEHHHHQPPSSPSSSTPLGRSPSIPFYDSIRKYDSTAMRRPPLASIYATPFTIYFIVFLSVTIIALDLLLFIAGF